MSLTIIKYFSICFCSIYFTSKINNLTLTYKTRSVSLICSLFSPVLIYFLRKVSPVLSMLFLISFVFIFLLLHTELPSKTDLFLSVISVACSYISLDLSRLIISPFISALIIKNNFKNIPYNINLITFLIIGILHILLCLLLCKNQRLMNGFRHLIHSEKIDTFLCLSLAILFTLSCLNSKRSLEQNMIYLLPLYLLDVLFFLVLKNRIMQVYLDKLKSNELQSLKNEVRKLKTDNDIMAKQIHKDNKILPVMQLSILELTKEYGETEKITELQEQLEILEQERYRILSDTIGLPVSCNIPSTNAIFRYFYNKGKQENIHFEFSLNQDVLKEKNIQTNDLNTLLCDLCENAMTAVKTADQRHVLLCIEACDSTLTIAVFDSGAPFVKEVLENLGKQKITTHAENGGNGIGLMTVFEILEKYQGEFQIQNCDSDSKYTKCVTATLHSL